MMKNAFMAISLPTILTVVCCASGLFLGATLSWSNTASEQDTDGSVAPQTNQSPPTTPSNCRDFRIVLDVGHTPQLPGTLTARGRTEYELNLNLGASIRALLVDRGFRNVYLLKMTGGLETLKQRDAEANKLHANLFISIHHDSVQDSYLKTWIVRGKPQQYSDKFSGYSLFVSEKNRYWQEAFDFATALSDQLLKRNMRFTLQHAKPISGENRELLDNSRGIYRFDDLVVLKGFNGPAILFEAAVVVNRNEELIAESERRHQLIGNAMFDAIQQFCKMQTLKVNRGQ